MVYDLKKLIPEAYIKGIDISNYAIENCKEEVKDLLTVGDAKIYHMTTMNLIL